MNLSVKTREGTEEYSQQQGLRDKRIHADMVNNQPKRCDTTLRGTMTVPNPGVVAKEQT